MHATPPNHQQPLPPELDAIATAAADRLRAHCGDNPGSLDQHAQRVADAAAAAIHAGAALSAIAEAERVGEERRGTRRCTRRRARNALRADTVRKVERAAKRMREADTDYDQAIDRAARLGLSHREIATAAAVSHGTIRAVLARTQTHGVEPAPAAVSDDTRTAHQTNATEPLAA